MLQNNKNIFALILTLLFFLNACGKEPPAESTEGTERTFAQTVVSQEDTETESISAPAAEYSSFDLNTQTKDRAVYIQFSGSEAVYDDDAVQDKDGILTITRAGDYVLTGTSLCQVVVDAGAEDDVHLILDNLTLTADMAPLYIKKAKNICITLAENSENRITDTAQYTFSETEDEPDAAVFSKCDLTINGSGSLVVEGNYACGIRSKDDLKIVDGQISVTSVSDAVKGRDSLLIRDGTLRIHSGADGLKSNNDEDPARGYIIIEGGNIEIEAGDDAVHAETWLQIFGGDIHVTGSYEALEGMKIEIYGGNLDLLASDDCLNAAGSGNSSGFNPEFVNTGRQNMQNSRNFIGAGREEMPVPTDKTPFTEGDFPDMPPAGFEGFASPPNEENAFMPETGESNHGGRDNEQFGAGRSPENFFSQGQNDNRGNRGGGMGLMNESAEEGVYILVAGGTVRVESGVDIIDSNGTFTQTGGTLITVGPSMQIYGSPEGIIDTNGDAVVNEGTFISFARSGGNALAELTEHPGFILSVGEQTVEGHILTVTDQEGSTVLSVPIDVNCRNIFVTSDLFCCGENYTVSCAGKEISFTAEQDIQNIR